MIAYFLEPLGMTLALFIIGLFFLFRNKYLFSKIFLSLSFSLLFLYSYPPFANFLVTHLENKYPKYDYKSDAKYIHVLGNGHHTDDSQPLSSQLTEATIKRDLEGILIHFNTPGSKLIFTGYKGLTEITAAKMNQKLALELGVKPENIIINGLPKDTKEEALFIKSLIKNEDFILVTSATHMPRSMLLFKSLGLNPIPAPTNYHTTEFDGYLRLPTTGDFEKSRIAIHEYIGILWSMLSN